MKHLGATRITDSAMDALELPSYENGYYWITEDLTVDCEGTVRLNDGKNYYICQLYTMEEIKLFIEWVNR